MVTVRSATAEDSTFLKEMLVLAADWEPGPRRRSVEEVMSDPALARYLDGWPAPGDVGVIAESERPVGAAWWRFFSADAPAYGFVSEDVPEMAIAVSEPFRRRGIGQRMLEQLIEHARKERLTALCLSVNPANPAVRLYRRLGFQVVGGRGDSQTMLLRLQAPEAAPGG